VGIYQQNAGFSLVETLVAMTLGLILISGAMQVYLSFKKTYINQAQLIAAQENGRAAILILSAAIRTSGYSGCQGEVFFHPLEGISQTSPASDGIIIKTANSNIAKLTMPIDQATNIIYATNNPADQDNPDLLIADCVHAQLFKATSFGKQIKTAIAIQPTYQILDTEIGRVTTTTYFIKKTKRKNIYGKPVFALYSTVNAKQAEELIEGINQMQIEYGILGAYLAANQVSNWDMVQSVHLILTVDLGNGATKTWETYVALRN
jgi:type IV pilus assembly protein PilW